ncbi:MAG: hypothetical protein VYB54_03565 [Pseudomonadota bacterium]|nr:hypothetical protein [Pseudomonadota bacterium]
MRAAVLDPECAFFYGPVSRGYGLHSFRDNPRPVDTGGNPEHGPRGWTIDRIGFCPWCGIRLPRGLSSKRDAELTAMGIDPEADVPLPDGYADDRWWRGRKLRGECWLDSQHDLRPACRDTLGNFGVADHCPRMFRELADGRSSFTYVARWREYGIRCFDQDRPVWSQPPRWRPVYYSPWCGRRYPYSLRATWESFLELDGITGDTSGLPVSMLTDLWWRHRPDRFGDSKAGSLTPPPNHCRPPKDQLPDGDPRIAPPATPGRRDKSGKTAD